MRISRIACKGFQYSRDILLHLIQKQPPDRCTNFVIRRDDQATRIISRPIPAAIMFRENKPQFLRHRQARQMIPRLGFVVYGEMSLAGQEPRIVDTGA